MALMHMLLLQMKIMLDDASCECRSAFKNYVKKIINRRNTITGVLYRDDPTIMAWDLANEPYVLGDASGDILTVCKSWGISVLLQFENREFRASTLLLWKKAPLR